MNQDELVQRVEGYMRELTRFPDRHVGGEGNRAATALFAAAMAGFGYEVRRTELSCLEWVPGEARLEFAAERHELHVGPYTPPCDITAPLVPVSTVEELEADQVRGAIVLLHGAIAAHQVMPRNFTFYNPEEHQRIYRALDAFAPAGVLSATGRDPEMVGSQYPFPLFEDGDLEVPNAYLTDEAGRELLQHSGERARLVIVSERRPSSAEHVVAWREGSGRGRVVLSAHIDSRRGSPGALDNASGVATLLAAAELLAGQAGPLGVEFVPFNGEDDYANPGELRWLAENEGRFDDIVLGINVDDSGQRGAGNDVSLYSCPPEIEEVVRAAMTSYDSIGEGPQWYQGDHSLYVMQQRPAIAIASDDMHEFMARYAHTDGDVPELADAALIGQTATFIAEVVRRLMATL